MKPPKLSNACDRFGSSFGRDNTASDRKANGLFYLARMKMSPCGAYDQGGAYWGFGDACIGWMYRAYNEAEAGVNECFVRAKNRDEAKEKVRKVFQYARFYR